MKNTKNMKNTKKTIRKPKHKFIPNESWPEHVKNYESKWPEIKGKKALAMTNTAVMQVISALLFGNKYFLVDNMPSIDLRKLPMEFVIGQLINDKLVLDTKCEQEVMQCGYNMEYIVKMLMSYAKEEDGVKKYACNLAEHADDEFSIYCPMYIIYDCVHAFVMSGGRNARKRMAKRSTKRRRWKK